MITTEHFGVITPSGYSNIYTVCIDGKYIERSRKTIETIEEAKLAIRHFGESSSLEYSKYWEKIALECKIVKVTTIIENIEL